MNNLAFQETEEIFESEVVRRTYANQFATEDDDFFDPPEYVKSRESYKWIISYNKSVDPLANQEGSLSFGTEIAESSGAVIQKDLTNSSDREAQELIFIDAKEKKD